MRNWPFDNLAPLSFDLIAVDPPWEYEAYSERGHKKGAKSQYDCLPPEEIAEMFPVDQLAGGDCLLLCWATQPLLDRQIACVKRWGFVYKSLINWEKVFPSGRSAIGTGYRVRSMCEPIILATIGEPKHKAFPGLFSGVRREHSRKPESFYSLVEDKAPRLFRRADIFSRQNRPGWQSWGREKGKFDAPPHPPAVEAAVAPAGETAARGTAEATETAGNQRYLDGASVAGASAAGA
jgi:N6-adenosine-specific RNA methylase IME4